MAEERGSRLLVVLLLSVIASTATASTCSEKADSNECLNHRSKGLMACTWCEVDQMCHDVGAIATDPCGDPCCASRSSLSGCHHREVSTISARCETEAFQKNTTAFSSEMATRAARFTGASYCEPQRIWDMTCTHCEKLDKVQTVLVAEDPLHQLQAFVAIDRSDILPLRVVSFRGTVEKEIQDWVDDLKYWQITPYMDAPDLGVHKGFYEAYHTTLKAQILAALDDPKNSPGAPILVTGHSLGGALAVVAAFDLSRHHNKTVQEVYTFGQPRVGNRAFAVAYKATVRNHWRVTHRDDVIPHVPLVAQGFAHAPHEVFFPDDSSLFVMCDGHGEDGLCSNRCSDSFQCKSVSDHLLYMGVAMGTNQCEHASKIMVE